MGKKPSLILELDSHTSDAGVETRIEAFADVVRSSLERKTDLGRTIGRRDQNFDEQRTFSIELQDGRHIPITDPSVKVIVPYHGRVCGSAYSGGIRKGRYKHSRSPQADRTGVSTGKI